MDKVGNILDQPNKVSWRSKNSHFETIDQHGKRNYYPALSAGSISLSAGTTVISKDRGCKVLLFPLDKGVSMNVQGHTVASDQFTVDINKATWVGFVTTGGTINPI